MTLQTLHGLVAVSPDTSARPTGILLPAASLCRRELVRFLRQPNRIIGALATPLVFWLLIGGGMGSSLRLSTAGLPAESYIRFFFPGTAVMILLFTAIFSTISIIEDRREGFLQSVLVAPVSRHAIVLGKVLGGTVLASLQGLLFLILAPLVGFEFTIGSFALAAAFMLVMAFALTSLGFCIAWPMSSTQGFHAIMNLFLMPLWFLSGALFPATGAWWGLEWIMRLNPLSYGLAGLRQAMRLSEAHAAPPGPPLWVNALVSCGFAALLYVIASRMARRHTAGDLQ